ncbi:tyrosine-type recombinase/integrase [Synechocystis sp. PCC 7509]|uniref:tyrosine-type recombinase/integrase n=1 Tax=Synechocystis sp. PCC 7509 TaxID=927677 RepID=UPI0002ACB0BB|nr:tyrosine-type recombinase/integrase [Synechocystis sp. PCC 7509]
MKLTLQKGIDPNTLEIVWLMLDGDYQVIEPIQRYLTYLSTNKSPKTVEAYGYDFKLWWAFLDSRHLDWRNIKLNDIEDFAYWLRVGDTSVLSIQPVEAKRSEKSINRAITAIMGFYDYHIVNQTVDFKQFNRFYLPYGITRQGLLAGIAKSNPIRQKLVKLKEPKKFPGCLTDEQVEILVNTCHRLRDKFIILMLNGTGMRIGELLGLQHDDVGDANDYFIQVKKRNNLNEARAKGQERFIPVIPELLKMYDDYLIYEYPEVESPYVFVNIWEGVVGQPMKAGVINTMFYRLSEKTGIKVYPHLFRHSYATRLLKAKYPPERVKHLLGHASIQTTLDIYSHVLSEGNLIEVVEREENK